MDMSTLSQITPSIAFTLYLAFKAAVWLREQYRDTQKDEREAADRRADEIHRGIVLALHNGAGDVFRGLVKEVVNEALAVHEEKEKATTRETLETALAASTERNDMQHNALTTSIGVQDETIHRLSTRIETAEARLARVEGDLRVLENEISAAQKRRKGKR